MRTSPDTTEPSEIKVHFIEEWAEAKRMTRADIGRELGADKSLVSRWFAGAIPSEKWLMPLAESLGTDVHGLFRHPEDDSIIRIFKGRPDAQRKAAISMLRLFFESNSADVIEPMTSQKRAKK